MTKKDDKGEPDASELTPSGLALAAVGEPDPDATDEELVEHANKYLEAKLKARRG